MRARFALGCLLVLSTAGCAVGVDDALPAYGKDSGAVGGDSASADDSVGPDGEAPDTSVAPDTATAPDTTAADGVVAPDTSVADTAMPDTTVTDTATPDTATPDTATPDTATPDTATPDTGVTCAVRGCATGTESRSGCANARTIGRTTASTTTGYKISDDLCSASNKFDESGSSCWDANADHAYKIWMMAGETIDISVSTSWPCSTELFSWYATLKIIENSGCDDAACTTRTFCAYNKFSHTKNFVAPRDGWYILVVEGSSAFDDEGDYTFTVKLSCKTAGCGCT